MTPHENQQPDPIAPDPIALVVDDEPLVLMDTSDMVADEGYQIIEASTVDKALLILERQESIELLLTDVQTPGLLDGFELARTVARRWPRICIIATSGGTRPRHGDLPATATFVGKPLSPEIIHKAIRDHCRSHPHS